MEYTIKFTNGKRFIAFALLGMVLLIAIPIILRIKFGFDETTMIVLCFSGLVLPWFIGYFAAQQKVTILLSEDGLFTKKYGLIKWPEVDSLGLMDNNETEIFTIRLQSGKKISIPSTINNSLNRQTFLSFKNEVQSQIAQRKNTSQSTIQHSYAFEGKGYRLFGYALILILIIVTVYAITVGFKGEISGKELTGLITAYGAGLPMIARIFRKELFGN